MQFEQEKASLGSFSQKQDLQRFDNSPEQTTQIPGPRLDSTPCHSVYRRLLSLASLEPKHKQDLIRRGLSDEQIGLGAYASLPQGNRQPLALALVREFGEQTCSQVPGLIGSKSNKWSLAGYPGLLIPIRASDGRISGLKIRSDSDKNESRYSYFSSAPDQGPRAISAIHHPVFNSSDCSVLRLTEGELKADVASALSGVRTISVPGVGSWRKGVEYLIGIRVRQVLLAFDSDAIRNSAVAQALVNSAQALMKENIEVILETWPPIYKGIDDALLSGASIEKHQGELVPELLNSILTESCDAKVPLDPISSAGTKGTKNQAAENLKIGNSDIRLRTLSNTCTVTSILLRKADSGDHLTHVERRRLAQIGIAAGMEDEPIKSLFQHQGNFDPSKTAGQIKSLRAGHQLPSCKKISQDLARCDGKCSPIQASGGWSPIHLIKKQNEGELPEIVTNLRQFRFVHEDAVKAIQRSNYPEPQIFQRLGKLVRLRNRRAGVSGTEESLSEIESISQDALFGYLTIIADWKRHSEKGLVPVKPDSKIAPSILASVDPDLPTLARVVATPFISRDGILVDDPGYHRPDSTYLDPKGFLIVPTVSKHPSGQELDAALNLLRNELFGDFPFVSASDRAHALAALLLPFIRNLIRGETPLHGVEAPTPGTGKGLLVNVISIIATGMLPEKRSLPTNDDEIRKMITAELSRGKPMIVLDNAPSSILDSPSLAAVLTANPWADRLLGQSLIVSYPNLALWLITGNNIRLSSELSRRYVPIRIDPKRDRPWLRSGFLHSDLVGWAQDHRAELVWAALTIIQAWIVKGRPKSEVQFGSFENWAATLGGILELVGVPGFLGNLNSVYESADAEGQEWRAFFAAWWKQYAGASQRPSDLRMFCHQNDLMAEIRGTGNEQSQNTRLGSALQAAIGRVYGEYLISLERDKGKHGKFYRLELAKSPSSWTGPEPLSTLQEIPTKGPHANTPTNLIASPHAGTLEDLKQGTQGNFLSELCLPGKQPRQEYLGDSSLQGPQGPHNQSGAQYCSNFQGGPTLPDQLGSPPTPPAAGAQPQVFISQAEYDAI